MLHCGGRRDLVVLLGQRGANGDLLRGRRPASNRVSEKKAAKFEVRRKRSARTTGRTHRRVDIKVYAEVCDLKDSHSRRGHDTLMIGGWMYAVRKTASLNLTAQRKTRATCMVRWNLDSNQHTEISANVRLQALSPRWICRGKSPQRLHLKQGEQWRAPPKRKRGSRTG